MARPKKEVIAIKKCLHCGMELEYKLFYRLNSHSNLYTGNDNHIPVCKDCIKILYEQYRMKYINQISVLGIELEENEIEKLVIRRLCMTFDIYYSNKLFGAALRNQEKFTNVDLITAYMRIINLKQNKNKTYDDTIAEENLSQELVKSAIADKVKGHFEDNELYQNIYDLCLKLMQSLKKNCDIDFQNN